MTRILARVAKVITNPEYAMRRGLESVRCYNAQKKVLPLVRDAIESRGAQTHKLIQSEARIAYGLQSADQKQVLKAEKFLEDTVRAMAHLYEKGFRWDFGVCSLGFRGLSCLCTSRSQMEASVYLYGFCPPLNLFCTYCYLLRDGSCAVDVGGNLGLHALVMASAMAQDGLVYTYEPRKEIVRKLEQNLAANNIVKRVNIRNIGLGRKKGSVAFNDEAANFNEGLGHIDGDSEYSIEITSMDEDIGEQTRHISLIKIDVEGMELEVLAGAQRILQQHRPALVIEYNEDRPPEWNIDRLRQCIPYAIQVFGIPRRIGKLAVASKNGKFPGCDDILAVPTGRVIDVEKHIDFLNI